MNWINLLVVGSFFALPTDLPPTSTVKSELERFQGSWSAVSVQNVDGTQMSAADLKETQLIVKGDRFTLKVKQSTITGTFSIEPSQSPKAIDVILDTKEGEKPANLKGIYQIEGETRKSFFAMPGESRPKEFSTTAKGFLQLEWKQRKSD